MIESEEAFINPELELAVLMLVEDDDCLCFA